MEPWLAGRFSHLAPLPRLLCCSLEQSLSEIRRWTEPLSGGEIWNPSLAGTSIGFHLRHLAGSVDRLTAYAQGKSLNAEQLEFLRSESLAGEQKETLLAELESAFSKAAAFAASATDFDAPRFIGRQRLETPLGVLLGHIAEHTQRHTGQIIVLAKIIRRSQI